MSSDCAAGSFTTTFPNISEFLLQTICFANALLRQEIALCRFNMFMTCMLQMLSVCITTISKIQIFHRCQPISIITGGKRYIIPKIQHIYT